MKVVLDTNIYISAFVFGGVPRIILEEAERGIFQLVSSLNIKEETERILQDKFSWSKEKINEAIGLVWEISEIVLPKETFSVLKDEADNRILECAFAGKVFCIVTGDKDLLALGKFKNILILTLREFSIIMLKGKK